MALKSTICKAELRVSDMGRNYYNDHNLTIARHPSETDKRMMVRLLAFALHAHEALAFGNDIGTDDEPALWQKDLTGAIELWIDVGQPDEKRIRKACGRAKQVYVYSYGGHGADLWNDQIRKSFEGTANLVVVNLPAAVPEALAQLANRSMRLQCTVQEGQIYLSNSTDTVHIDLSATSLPVK